MAIESATVNPWLERAFFHWAHQGGAREGPSNTLHAMTKALEAGADGIEMDVHATRDGRVVVLHDDTVDRTTNGQGRVAQYNLEELQRFDAAHWWVEEEGDSHEAPELCYILRAPKGQRPAPDLRIPTLDEVLDRVDVPLTIEVKVPEAVEPLVDLLRARQVAVERLIVTSFKQAIVKHLRKLAPELPLAPGERDTVAFFLRTRLGRPPKRSPYVAIQVPPVFDFADRIPRRWRPIARLVPRRLRSFTVVDDRFIKGAHRSGMAVHVWTIDMKCEMRRLIGLGVDGIMTDRPSALTSVLGRTSPGS
jgi:glycerophosphoryl diester phosphodiesterase